MTRFLKYWLPVLLWMGLIFFMSTDEGSAMHTGSILEPLLRWIYPGISAEAVEWVHFIVRKCGHLGEYAVLGLLLWRALMQTRLAVAANPALRCAGMALLATAAYAGTDEFHQSFVPSRTASVRDVLIDSTGALLALCVLLLWRVWRNRVAARQDRSKMAA